MTFATDAIEMVNELIGEFDERTGTDRVRLLKQGDRVWNPAIGDYVIGPDTEYYLKVVTINVSAGMVDGTTIQSGDQIMTVSTSIVDINDVPADIVPLVNDKIVSDGVQWSIVDVPHVNYTGNALTVVYKLQIRK